MPSGHVIDREELSWAAGFFDGEGCFSYVRVARYPVIRVTQAHREPLDRFQAAIGVGKVYGPMCKDTRIGGRGNRSTPTKSLDSDRSRVAAMLWFKLGTMKREQARTVLERGKTCR